MLRSLTRKKPFVSASVRETENTWLVDDTAVAVALQKGSPLLASINEILATITPEQREELMQWAVDNQPLAAE